jgi:DNA polymerase elongation subunit (family B)
MYEDRKKYKKLMLKAKQDLIDCKDDAKKPEIEARISRYNNLQLAKKVSLNSAYGAFGSKYFRLFDLRQAIAVTSSGQLAIRWIANKLNGYMNKLLETNTDYVIASDTDSIYLNMGPLVDKVFKDSPSTEKIIDFMDKVSEEKIQPFIQKSYQELADYTHAYAQKMNMKRENLCDKGIWTAKKRYILNVYDSEGVRYTEPELKVTGLEMIKSSTPSVIRDKMKQSIKIIINGTQDDIHKFIETARMEFRKLPVEDISFPRGVSGVSEYSDKDTIYKKGTPIHVRGALVYNHNIREKGLSKKYQEIKEGEKLKFVYLRLPNPIRSDVIAFPNRLPPEFDLEKYVDRDIQFQKTFIEPIKIVLDCIGWTTEKSHSLFD